MTQRTCLNEIVNKLRVYIDIPKRIAAIMDIGKSTIRINLASFTCFVFANFEYAFMKRLAINTGIVLVDNKYEAYGEDYHAPARYWKNGIVADEAYGECQMIDIPLNLRYNFVRNGKHYAFINAGMSTYFVTKEDYYFHYEQDDPDLPMHWGTDKTTIYPFGIVNFSLGYELELTPKSGFQIEPFIKIPTKGIGWGNVDLHTMGVYFMYKYKL